MKKNKSGFTLIELLIVISIILILIAIALPNFLEAQIRSKVVKVKGEMQSISVSLESYFIDWNQYPWASEFPNINIPATAPIEPFELHLSSILTSPIRYINELPRDIFNNLYTEDSDINLYAPYHYTSNDMNILLGDPELFNELTEFLFFQKKSIKYFLLSHGPDSDHDEFGEHSHTDGTAALYNPTNGSKSNGDIYYFN